MTLWSKTGVLTKDATSGAHNQTFSSIWSESPKVLFLWGTKNTSTNAYAEGITWFFGYSDGTTSSCIAQSNLDNSASQTSGGVIRDDAIIEIINDASGTAALARGTVSSWNSTDLVINWTTANTTQYVFQYFAIGGSDITNVKVINGTAGRTTTGTQDYASFGFNPAAGDILFAMTINDGATAYNSYRTTDNNVSVGAAMSTTSRWNLCSQMRANTGASNCSNRLGIDGVLWVDGLGTTVSNASDWTAWITGGVRLTHGTAYAATTCPISMLIIKGGQWDIGTFAQKSGSGTQDVTTTSGRTAQGVAIFGTMLTSTNTFTAICNNSIGACDTTTEGCITFQNVDASDPMVVSVRTDTNKVAQRITAAATATSSTIVSEADVTAMSPTTGKFTLNWTTGDTSLRQHAWFAASGTAGAAPQNITKSITDTPSISISETLTPARNKIRTRSETVTATD